MRLARRFASPISVLAVAAAAVGLAHSVGLRLNLTPSLPRGVYFLRPGVPARGTLVAACLPAEAATVGRRRGYLGSGTCANESAPVLKFVAAVAGDVVEIGTDTRVNGAYLQSAPPIEDRAGRPLGAYPTGRYMLRRGELWLYSPSPHSWDSRFFGPVSMDEVLGVVRPLWTWDRPSTTPT
ncbi:MAG: conjugative transfer signal peptidase TraF [Deltaproteobacteria bacterium]|nr:conjugative transfer signal peptidase TraF [Deltaproteobacteria bacterium]